MAVQWRWKWCPGQYYACPTVCPIPCGANEITLHVGTTYQLFVFNGDPEGSEPHALYSVGAIGLVGGFIPPGGALPIQYITPDTPGDYNIKCSNTMCGPPNQHENMLGAIHVVP